jgi:hypothetical protein
MKISRNLDPSELNQVSLNTDDPRTYLNEIYQYVKSQAIDAINWYLKRKGPASRFSKSLRLLAIIVGTLGAVFPLLQSTDFAENSNNFSQYGYILLALAGGCVLLDKLFGFSSNWMRYMNTIMRLKILLAEFEMDWARLTLRIGSGSINEEQQEEMFDCLTEFRLNVMEELKNETQKWIEEFRSNMDRLEVYTSKAGGTRNSNS